MSTTVTYKGNAIATADNDTVTLETAGTWLEDDITLTDVTSGGGVTPTGTKQISITQNGTTTEDVTNYASAEITVNVSGGSSVTAQDLFDGTFPTGDVTITNKTTVGTSLYGNTAITSFSSPSITQFRTANAFYGCTALKTVSLTGAITQNQSNMWQNCTNLESIEMPNYNTTLGTYSFGGCSKLEFADLGKCSQIMANCFNGASSLTKIVLRRTSVCTLQNVSAFSNTPFKSGGTGGTIYVPSSLISSYQSASNWSTINGYGTITWAAIEGSEYEL